MAAGIAAVVLGDLLASSDGDALDHLSRATAFATVAALAGAVHTARAGTPAALPALPVHNELTKRELEILAAMAEGKTNAQIAADLTIAESTVKSHVKNIMRKLGAANRAQAVCWYCRASRSPVGG
jgi:DNA-binding NarL/FixJ family response regulator